MKVDINAEERRLVFEGLLHVRQVLIDAVSVADAEGQRDTRAHRDLADVEQLLARMRQRASSELDFEAAWQHFVSRRREH